MHKIGVLREGDSAIRRLFDGLVLAGVGENRFCSLHRAEGVDSIVDTDNGTLSKVLCEIECLSRR